MKSSLHSSLWPRLYDKVVLCLLTLEHFTGRRPRRYSEQMLKLGLIRELIDPIQVDPRAGAQIRLMSGCGKEIRL